MGFLDFFSKKDYDKPEVDKEYQKICNYKIKKLCGGRKPNEYFDSRVRLYRPWGRTSNIFEKRVLTHECKYGLLKAEHMENRLNQLVKLDCETLSKIMYDVDTSTFKSQEDLDKYMGEEYVRNYQELVRKQKEKYELKLKREKEEREEHIRIENEKELKRIQYENNLKAKSVKTFDIEIFTKVKSNTALASAVLFLATGVLAAEEKKEMKYVRTKLNIKEDGIEIRNPHSYHKFIDFRGFKVDKEDNYYLFYIVLLDEVLIHFRTRNENLHEVILDKINSNSGLYYEHV